MPLKSGMTGVYVPQNKDKYIGEKLPVFKSLFEQQTFFWCDTNKNVVKWGYEVVVVNYVYSVDSTPHRYFVDLYVEVIDNGKVVKYLLEIKPKEELTPPKQPKTKNPNSLARFQAKAKEFIKNKNKWDAARLYAKQRGMVFQILTEDHIFGSEYKSKSK